MAFIYYPDGNGGRMTLNGGESISGDDTVTTPSDSSTVIPDTVPSWSIYYPDGDGGRLLLDSDEETENYTLPTASETVKGGVKIGAGLSMTGDVLNVLFPTASASVKGCMAIGSGLSMLGDTLNVVFPAEETAEYSLPTASQYTKGGIKIGTGLSMAGDVLNVSLNLGDGLEMDGNTLQTTGSNYTLPTASQNTKGGVRIGNGLAMNGDILNVTLETGSTSSDYSLPTASESVLGGVMVGYGLSIVDGSLSVTLTNPFAQLTEGYGQVVTVPTTSSSAIDTESLNAWDVFNFATYNEATGWNGAVIVNLPEEFESQSYTIEHIHNVSDYSEIVNYAVFQSGEDYRLRVPAEEIVWQTELPTQLVIHGSRTKQGGYSAYELPTMSESIKGGAKVGYSLIMTEEFLNVALGTTSSTLEGAMWISTT